MDTEPIPPPPDPEEPRRAAAARGRRRAVLMVLGAAATFTLAAALNPCPCGYFNDSRRDCICSPRQIARYLAKISGPLLDRVDLQVEVAALTTDEIASVDPGESSSSIRDRVDAAVLHELGPGLEGACDTGFARETFGLLRVAARKGDDLAARIGAEGGQQNRPAEIASNDSYADHGVSRSMMLKSVKRFSEYIMRQPDAADALACGKAGNRSKSCGGARG